MWNSGSGAKTVSTADRQRLSAMKRPRRRKYSWVWAQNFGVPVVPEVCMYPARSSGRPVETGHGVQRLGPDGPAALPDLPVDGIGQVEHGCGRPGRDRAADGGHGVGLEVDEHGGDEPVRVGGVHQRGLGADQLERQPRHQVRIRALAQHGDPAARTDPGLEQAAGDRAGASHGRAEAQRLRRAVGSGRPRADRPEAGVGTARGAVEDQLGQVPHASPSYESERSTRRAT